MCDQFPRRVNTVMPIGMNSSSNIQCYSYLIKDKMSTDIMDLTYITLFPFYILVYDQSHIKIIASDTHCLKSLYMV